MTRIYVLDTSVLLSDPRALFSFEEHQIVLPLVVVKELERHRSDPTLGWAARSVLRTLERLRVEYGTLVNGVPVNERGGTVRIELNHVDQSTLPDAVKREYSHDARILAVATALERAHGSVVLVTNDLPLRLLAGAACDLVAEEYGDNRRGMRGREYSGMAELEVSSDVVDEIHSKKAIPLSELGLESQFGGMRELPPLNCGLILKSWSGSALATVGEHSVDLVSTNLEAFGVTGRSAEQRVALSHLLNPEMGVVSLGGPAGTGKSLLALAAALELVLERRTARRILVFRPVFAVGEQEIGFLPGNIDEKMAPFTQATLDALRAFTTDTVIEDVQSRRILEVLPLTHIRGRTFSDDIVLIDECQNLTRSALVTALSRIGEGSRVFLQHDVAQRDNLKVGRYDGINSIIDRLKGQPLFGHVSLVKSERSAIAEMVNTFLD